MASEALAVSVSAHLLGPLALAGSVQLLRRILSDLLQHVRSHTVTGRSPRCMRKNTYADLYVCSVCARGGRDQNANARTS